MPLEEHCYGIFNMLVIKQEHSRNSHFNDAKRNDATRLLQWTLACNIFGSETLACGAADRLQKTVQRERIRSQKSRNGAPWPLACALCQRCSLQTGSVQHEEICCRHEYYIITTDSAFAVRHMQQFANTHTRSLLGSVVLIYSSR